MQVTVHGTLKGDGTLILAESPALPAGPVEVVIRPVQSATPGEDWWSYLQRARAGLEAAGHSFRTKDAIDAEIDELRSDL
jgi:hypothetical protein